MAECKAVGWIDADCSLLTCITPQLDGMPLQPIQGLRLILDLNCRPTRRDTIYLTCGPRGLHFIVIVFNESARVRDISSNPVFSRCSITIRRRWIRTQTFDIIQIRTTVEHISITTCNKRRCQQIRGTLKARILEHTTVATVCKRCGGQEARGNKSQTRAVRKHIFETVCIKCRR